MKNLYSLFKNPLRILMLLVAVFAVQSVSAKKFTREYLFYSTTYIDNTMYIEDSEGTLWKVNDSNASVDWNGTGVYLQGGSDLKLTSDKIFPASAKVTVNAGAAAQIVTDFTIYVDNYSQDMEDTYKQYFYSASDITLNDYTFNLNRSSAGNIEVEIYTYSQAYSSILIHSITVEYEADYGLSVTTLTGEEIAITDDNRLNVLNEEVPTVQFDGNNKLVLNKASLGKITIGEVNELQYNQLNISLKGVNSIRNGEKAIVRKGSYNTNMDVYFSTNESTPGSLHYINTAGNLNTVADAFKGFTLYYNNGLKSELTKDDGQDIVDITSYLTPIVDKENMSVSLEGESGEGIGEDIEGMTTAELKEGVIVHNILYTLPGENDGYNDDPAVVAADGKIISINSQMTESGMNNVYDYWGDLWYIPGTRDFNNRFKGMTFKLPAGTGRITIKARTNETGVLNVKIGNSAALVFDDAKTEFKEYVIPFVCSKPTYVMIYNSAPATSSSRAEDNHRAPGRKETTTLDIKGVDVGADTVDDQPDPSLNPRNLTREEVNNAFVDGHVIIKDEDITGVDSNCFDDLADKEVTYVDLSETSLKTNIGRSGNYIFASVPESALVIVPIGNNLVSDPQNVVLGSVCKNLTLSDSKPFEAPVDFLAQNVTYDRDFSAMKEKGCTVYLPFALDEETAAEQGAFYLPGETADNALTVHLVQSTQANVPYLFKPIVDKLTLSDVLVKATTEEASSRRAAATATLVGTYQPTEIVSDATASYFIFDTTTGTFEKATLTETVRPFEAYLMAPATAPDSYAVVWSDIPAGIRQIKVGTSDNIYYDLQGRRVLYPQKGLYIVNGRKVMVK